MLPANINYSAHTYSKDQGGSYVDRSMSKVVNYLNYSGKDLYDDVTTNLNTSSGTVTVDQDDSNILDFQSDQFKSGVTFLAIRIHAVGEYAEVKTDTIAGLKKELAAKDSKLTANESELAAKDSKLAAMDSMLTAKETELTANESELAAMNSKLDQC